MPERRRGAGERSRDRRRLPRRVGLPLYAKLSPAAWDIAEAARAVEAAGADGVSLVNTLKGLALDPHALRPTLAGSGGYSASAEAGRARRRLRLREGRRIPIVGMGGVRSGLDALELIAAGASVVALGTVLFGDPGAPVRVRAELAAETARGTSDIPWTRAVSPIRPCK